MAKKEETPQRRARRNYEIRNKEEREQATKQFNTREKHTMRSVPF